MLNNETVRFRRKPHFIGYLNEPSNSRSYKHGTHIVSEIPEVIKLDGKEGHEINLPICS